MRLLSGIMDRTTATRRNNVVAQDPNGHRRFAGLGLSFGGSFWSIRSAAYPSGSFDVLSGVGIRGHTLN